MPRENRKRGRKHKRPKAEEGYDNEQQDSYIEAQSQGAGPSWIVDKKTIDADKLDSDAPFGFVEPDLKAYFRTVDDKLREWQDNMIKDELEADNEVDHNEERRIFMVAALSEASGKEKQLATDPDCSNTLERMAYSMDDFVKRVFVDRIAGSYEQLSRHRFGSHVLQTILSVSKGTIIREINGIVPPTPDSEREGQAGKLPSLSQLIVSLSEELLPMITSLLMDRFASHVLRALFLLLCPELSSSVEASNVLRSKKSAKYREKRGPMRSVFLDKSDEADEKGKSKSVPNYPPELREMAKEFVKAIRDQLSENEVRALAVNECACPLLVILIEMEYRHNLSNESGSIMDSLLAGLVSASLSNTPEKPEASDYVTTLLRDPAASHVLEKMVILAPQTAFEMMWGLYFRGKLNRLAVHPVANYVVARALERLNEKQFTEALDELNGSWTKVIKNAQTGVLKSLIDRSVQIEVGEGDICKVIFDTFDMKDEEAQGFLMECILTLKPYKEYKQVIEHKKNESNEYDESNSAGVDIEPTIQGSTIIQSLLKLHEPHNQKFVEGIISLPPVRLLRLSHHPISSHIIDALLTSPNVPSRYRRKLILAFQSHFPALVDNRVGSRVGERLWNAADPYLKEKVARALLPHESSLYGSRYGKFFIRGLNLYLLKRDPEKWKLQQSSVKQEANATLPSYALQSGKTGSLQKDSDREIEKPKRKREERTEDEIDKLFSSALGKRHKKGKLVTSSANGYDHTENSKESKCPGDGDLDSVLGAIRNAPKETKVDKKRKR